MRGTVALLRRMGRWAQAKRRTSAEASGPALPAPPPPVVTPAGENLSIARSGLPDPAGVFRLFTSPTGDVPWTWVNDYGIADPTIVTVDDLVLGQWYYATEVGAAPNYAGESLPGDSVQYSGS